MSYITKKNEVLRALEDIELRQIFQITNEHEDGVLMQAEQNMGNGKCVISLQLENRAFNGIYYSLGRLSNMGKKDNMLELLNSFNEENVMLKFYIDDDNSIMSQVMYIASDANFNADEYVSLIGPAFGSIRDTYYSKIMRVMWA